MEAAHNKIRKWELAAPGQQVFEHIDDHAEEILDESAVPSTQALIRSYDSSESREFPEFFEDESIEESAPLVSVAPERLSMCTSLFTQNCLCLACKCPPSPFFDASYFCRIKLDPLVFQAEARKATRGRREAQAWTNSRYSYQRERHYLERVLRFG
jgi:hypothetical protein